MNESFGRTHRPQRRTHRGRSDVFGNSARGEVRGIQIGPKIRIGGTVGKIGQQVKIGTGKVLSNPIVQGGIGAFLGPGAAAAAAAAGRALDTTNGGSGITDLALSGAKGYGVGKVGQVAGKVIGDKMFGGFAPGGGGSSIASKLPLSSLVGGGAATSGGAGGTSGGGGGILDSIGGFLHDNALPLAAGAAGAAAVGHERDEADKLTNRGIASAHEAYDAKAPLRKMALSQLTSNLTPNLSGRFATGATNPYAKKMPLSALRGG